MPSLRATPLCLVAALGVSPTGTHLPTRCVGSEEPLIANLATASLDKSRVVLQRILLRKTRVRELLIFAPRPLTVLRRLHTDPLS